MLLLILGSVSGFLAFYLVNVLVLLALARIERDENGKLLLDTGSWHFKLAYPFKKRDSVFLGVIREDGMNLCPYVQKLFWTLYLGWPAMILWETTRTVLCNSLLPFFGSYYRPGRIQEWYWNGEIHPLYSDKQMKEIPLPKLWGEKIRPIYLVILAIPAYFLITDGDRFIRVSLVALMAALITAVIFGIAYLVARFLNTKQGKASLAREWLQAKHRRICPKLEVGVR